MRERLEVVESPVAYVDDLNLRGHFAWFLCLQDRPPALWGLLLSGEGWDAVT